MVIVEKSRELDTDTHVSNVTAFMVASYQFNGLGDKTYQDMLDAGIPKSLIFSLYPYDPVQIVSAWEKNQRPWFRRRNRLDQLLHHHTLNRFVNALIELQRYMPSIYINDLLRVLEVTQPDLTFQHVGQSLARTFILRHVKRMNGNVEQFLEDMFNAAIFITMARPLDSVYQRQVKKDSKATTNNGFDAALADFFHALGRLVDLPTKKQSPL